MSGIFGQIGAPGAAASEAITQRMAGALRHHAWHSTETFTPDPIVAVGRQSIGVFNRAPQPSHHAQVPVYAWLAGEFVHQAETRSSLAAAGVVAAEADDVDLALAVYLRDGAEGLSRLEGAFLVAVWDGRTREFLLVNDRFGLYPHFYAHAGDGLTFAAELAAVLCNPAVPRALDLTTVAQFVRFQQALGDRTWFEGVRLLPPATCLRYQPAADALTLEQYWHWNRIPEPRPVRFDDAVEEGLQAFQRAIDARLAPPLRAGALLSGGLDGRTIVGFTPDEVPLATLTYGEAGCWDVIIARRLAKAAGRPHRWFPFDSGSWVREFAPLHTAVTSGLHGWTNAHGISVMPAAREWIDVNLSGFDGGTIFGGRLDNYHDQQYRDAADETLLAHAFLDGLSQRFNWPGLTEAEAHLVLGGAQGRALRPLALESLREELRSVTDLPPGRQGDFFYNEQVQRRVLLDQIVVQRTAVDVRCPFFDYAFIEFMYSLPDSIRTTPAFRSAVLTKRMPRLVRVPYEKDLMLPHSSPWVRGPHTLSRKVRNRVNRHVARVFESHPWVYADYENYLRGDLRAWAEDLLLGPRAQARGLFDAGAVRVLWHRHLAGQSGWTLGKIAPLMTIELALRQFVDGDGLAAPPGTEIGPGAAR